MNANAPSKIPVRSSVGGRVPHVGNGTPLGGRSFAPRAKSAIGNALKRWLVLLFCLFFWIAVMFLIFQ